MQWCFTSKELARPKSVVLEHLALEDERNLRIKACLYIYKVALKLSYVEIKPQVIATSQILLHRYYMRDSFNNSNYKKTAVACFFLAIKICDIHVKLKEVLKAWYRADVTFFNGKERELSESSNTFQTMQEDIIRHEDYISYTLCYDFTIETAYPYLSRILHSNNISASPRETQICTHILNDSYCLPLCLQYSPLQIAIATSYIGLSVAGRKLGGLDLFGADFGLDQGQEKIIGELISTLLTHYWGKIPVHKKTNAELGINSPPSTGPYDNATPVDSPKELMVGNRNTTLLTPTGS